MLFLTLAAFTWPISPDPSGPRATGIERLLGYAGAARADLRRRRLAGVACGCRWVGRYSDPPRAELVDVRNGPACGLQLDQEGCGRGGLAPARKRISVKTCSRPLKGERCR